MPKSTTTHGPPTPLVGRDRVDEPVGADLARVVHADRHAGPHARADDRHLVAEVALGHRRPLRPQLRHGRREDRRVEVGEARSRSASRLRSRAPSSSAVDSRTVAKRQSCTSSSPRKAPRWVCVLPTSTTRSTTRDYARPPMPAVLYAIPASHPCAVVERALQLKDVPYRRVELIPVVHKLPQQAALRRAVRAGRALRGRHARAGLARDPARARGARAEPAAAARRRGAARRASSARRSGATRCCSRSSRRILWAGAAARAGRDRELHRGRAAARAAARSPG